MGARGASGLGVEAPTNLASITPTAREATRGVTTPRQRQTHKQGDVRAKPDEFLISSDGVEGLKHHVEPITKSTYQNSRTSFNGGVILGVNVGGVICPEAMLGCNDSKYKGMDPYLKTNDICQGKLLKNEKPKFTESGGKFVEKIRSVQDTMYKQHDSSGGSGSGNKQPVINHVGYKVDNLKYYGELKSFKSYGAIDKPPVSLHDKTHQYASSEKAPHPANYEKNHARSLQNYCGGKVGDKSVYSDKYGDYYHRGGYQKATNAFPVFQETKYAYSVSGVPGTPAQASAAAAFFARSVINFNCLFLIYLFLQSI